MASVTTHVGGDTPSSKPNRKAVKSTHSESDFIINHPKKEPLLVIRQWQMEASKGDVCAAAVLSFLMYWQEIAYEEMREAEARGKTRQNGAWHFHTEKEIVDGIYHIAAETLVRQAIRFWEKKKFIKVGKNPKERYAFDRTNYFIVNQDAINKWISKRADRLSKKKDKQSKTKTIAAVVPISPEPSSSSAPCTVNLPHGSGEIAASSDQIVASSDQIAAPSGDFTDSSGVSTAPSGKKAGTIPEITAETTEENTEETTAPTTPLPVQQSAKLATANEQEIEGGGGRENSSLSLEKASGNGSNNTDDQIAELKDRFRKLISKATVPKIDGIAADGTAVKIPDPTKQGRSITFVQKHTNWLREQMTTTTPEVMMRAMTLFASRDLGFEGINRPFSVFMTEAEDLLHRAKTEDASTVDPTATPALVEEDEVMKTLDAIGEASLPDTVAFLPEQRLLIAAAVAKYGRADVVAGFRKFWGDVGDDDYISKKFAAKNFSLTCDQYIRQILQSREEQRKMDEMLARSIEQSRLEGERMWAEFQRKKAEEDALIEDELGA